MAETALQTPVTPNAVPDFLAKLGLSRGLGTQPDLLPSTPTPKSQFEAVAKRNTSQKPTSSKLPTIVAIAAAANGNFGPLSQLLEQKRKTQLFKIIQRPLKDRSAALQEGDTKLAGEIEAQIIGSIGGRSPEMLNMMSQLQAETTSIKRDAVYAKNWIKFLDPAMKAAEPNMPESTKNMYAMLKGAVGGNQHVSREFLQDFMNRNSQHWQNITGAYRGVSQLTGKTTTIPNVELVQANQLTSPAILKALGEVNLTPSDAMIIANNPRDPNSKAVRRFIAQAQVEQYKLELGKAIPLSDEITAQYQKLGATQDQLATRNFPISMTRTAIQNVNRNLIDRAMAPILAQRNLDPFLTSGGAVGVINSNPDSVNFGQDVRDESYALSAKDPDRAILSTQFKQNVVIPSIRAIKGLDAVDDMFASLTDPDNPITEGALRRLGAFFGIDISGDTTVAKAFELVATRAVEDVEATGAINDQRVGELKALIVGSFSDRTKASKTVKILQDRLRTQLKLYIGQNKGKPRAAAKTVKTPLSTGFGGSTVPGTGLTTPAGHLITPRRR